jgi:hypothetical protein
VERPFLNLIIHEITGPGKRILVAYVAITYRQRLLLLSYSFLFVLTGEQLGLMLV